MVSNLNTEKMVSGELGNYAFASKPRSRDRLLRRHGYIIHLRPNDREATWIKKGVVYTESEAEKQVLQSLEAVAQVPC